jgi:peptidoglycan/xylan/chitin deacetylase (PgdA/CDA1 family)
MDKIANNLKKHFYNILFQSKAYSIFEPFYSGLGSILLFHRVIPEADKIPRLTNNMSVTPDYLESCIIYFLQHDYQILSLDKMSHYLKYGRYKKKFVCFTFDDGYIDVYRYVYPLFKKYNLPFAAFITTGFPDKEAFIWWEMIEDLLLTKNCLGGSQIDTRNNLSFSTWAEKKSLLKILLKTFTSYKQDGLQDILQSLLGLNKRDLYNKQESIVASWEQIIEMSNNPNVTIGSHTVNHLALRYLTPKEIEYEVAKSKEILESKIKRKIEHFSYPYGSKSEVGNREIAILKKHGFKTGTTTRPGNIFPEHRQSLGSLPRIKPQPLIEGLGQDAQYLPFWLSGAISAIRNYGKRVI